MQYYKLTIAYDGTDYHGWQWQDSVVTVDQIVRSTIMRIFKQEKIYFLGCSRTDAGVHAQGQVARLILDIPFLEPEKIKKLLNNALPLSLSIKQVDHKPSTFHPHHDIEYKIYSYTIYTQRPSPEQARFGWYVWHHIDRDLLLQAAKRFIGTHDFQFFSKEVEKDTIKTVDSIICEENNRGTIVITVRGKTFLRYMIRKIVGAMIMVATGKLTALVIEELLKGKKYQSTLVTAPASGLCLEYIQYRE